MPSHVWLFTITWTATHQTSLSLTIFRSLSKFMSIESVVLFNHLILCVPYPSAFSLSYHQGLFRWVNCSHHAAKVLELQFQHHSFQIFRVDFLWDWLIWSPYFPRDSEEPSPAPEFKGINSLVLCLFYSPALTLCTTTRKTIASIIWTFVGKVMSLIFNMLFRFVIAFLPRSNHLLISCLQSPFAVILEPRKKSFTASTFSPSIRTYKKYWIDKYKYLCSFHFFLH